MIKKKLKYFKIFTLIGFGILEKCCVLGFKQGTRNGGFRERRRGWFQGIGAVGDEERGEEVKGERKPENPFEIFVPKQYRLLRL